MYPLPCSLSCPFIWQLLSCIDTTTSWFSGICYKMLEIRLSAWTLTHTQGGTGTCQHLHIIALTQAQIVFVPLALLLPWSCLQWPTTARKRNCFFFTVPSPPNLPPSLQLTPSLILIYCHLTHSFFSAMGPPTLLSSLCIFSPCTSSPTHSLSLQPLEQIPVCCCWVSFPQQRVVRDLSAGR